METGSGESDCVNIPTENEADGSNGTNKEDVQVAASSI